MPKFNPKKVAKVKAFDPDASYSVKDINGGTFAIAHNKKELKQLMKSDADVVYDESKGKLYFNANGEKKGWGKKKSGLLANFKGKPELNAENFEGLSAHKGDAITGDDIKDQITALSDELGDDKMSKLYGKTLINPKKGLKSIVKTGKKEGYKFDKKELGIALEEMDDAGAFSDIELDDAALATLLGMGGEEQRHYKGNC